MARHQSIGELMMQSRNLETPTGYLLTGKIKEINEKFNTDFHLEVTDAEPMFEDWLYCIKEGKRQFSDELDGQEMFAYLSGLYDGLRIGKSNG